MSIQTLTAIMSAMQTIQTCIVIATFFALAIASIIFKQKILVWLCVAYLILLINGLIKLTLLLDQYLPTWFTVATMRLSQQQGSGFPAIRLIFGMLVSIGLIYELASAYSQPRNNTSEAS